MVHGMDRPLSIATRTRYIPLCYIRSTWKNIHVLNAAFYNIYIYYTLHFHVTSKNSFDEKKKNWESKPRSFMRRDHFFIRYFYLRSVAFRIAWKMKDYLTYQQRKRLTIQIMNQLSKHMSLKHRETSLIRGDLHSRRLRVVKIILFN